MAMMRKFGAQMEYLTETHDEPMLKMIEPSINGEEEVCIKESEPGCERIVGAMGIKLGTVNNELSGKRMKEVPKRIEQVVALEPPPEPPDLSISDQPLLVLPRRVPLPKPPDPDSCVDGNELPSLSDSLAADSSVRVIGLTLKEPPVVRPEQVVALERREQPPKPRDQKRSVGRERDKKSRVEKGEKEMQTNLGELAASISLESPFVGFNSVHECVIVAEGGKILEKER
ncbi:hypothetical protein A2U01_0024701, partial [Trifolium medium]|nr:hypothetical protein [Trifolium medium]